MKGKFFNMIANEDGTACLLLYGNIGDWSEDCSPQDIVSELLELETAYKNIDVRINSLGGEVFGGIAIFNALKQSKANINIYIDGVAASIASVIAACGKPVKMSKYARLMVHSISGGTYGNKEEMARCIKEIEALEDTLADIYANRCKLTKDDIKQQFFDGKEHWFSGAEALELGLVDDLFDADPVPADSTPTQVYNFYQNKLNSKNMLLDVLQKRPAFANAATEDAVLGIIQGFENKAKLADQYKNDLDAANVRLQAFEAKEKQAFQDKCKTMLDNAVKDGRIMENQRESYMNLLEKDYENASSVLSSLQPGKRANGAFENNGEKSAWEERQEEIKNNLKKKKDC